jgi:hypothetical protein
MKKGETPEQYDARIESMATFQFVKAKNAKEIASQSDIKSRSNVTSNITSNQLQDKGPGALTTSAEDVESKEINNGVKHFETIASEPYKSPENKKLIKKYMDANGGDLAKAALALR